MLDEWGAKAAFPLGRPWLLLLGRPLLLALWILLDLGLLDCTGVRMVLPLLL